MLRLTHTLLAAGALITVVASAAHTQDKPSPTSVSVSGDGPETIVLLSGLVGGVAGYRRLEARLVAKHQRVVIIDPYLLSIESTDVSFAAQARRVDRVLDSIGVADADVVGHAHGAGANEPEPLAAVIARVRVPVTVLLGGAPHTAGPVDGELSALETLGDLLRVETMAGVGHYPHEEAPDEVARHLLAARREVVAAPGGAR